MGRETVPQEAPSKDINLFRDQIIPPGGIVADRKSVMVHSCSKHGNGEMILVISLETPTPTIRVFGHIGRKNVGKIIKLLGLSSASDGSAPFPFP